MAKAAYRILFLCPILFLLGCSWGQRATSPVEAWTPSPPPVPSATDSLGVLNWTAGVSIIGGIIALVMTAGRLGMRAIVCGASLIILSYVIAVYANLVLLPILIVITIVSGLLGYLTIVKAWKQRRS